jgi:hypothetical protein
VAIRKSAAGAIHHLIAELADPDAAVRDAAGARLAIIGERAVSHLIDAFRVSPSAVARAHMLQVIETTHDRRGVTLAIEVLAARPGDPIVVPAAIHLLGAFIEDEGTEPLDALGTIVLDTGRPEAERLAAWSAIARMPAWTHAPIRARLRTDANPILRAIADLDPREPAPGPSARGLVDAALSGDPVDPAALVEALQRSPDDVAVPVLHQLIEELGGRERRSAVQADRDEWTKARAAVHGVLAGRGSRVALYDVRDTLASASGPLPDGFLSAAGLLGDAACLESIADALARVPARLDRHEQQWRDRLVAAGRAIVSREGLTRRHAAVKRLTRKHPDVVRVLLAT